MTREDKAALVAAPAKTSLRGVAPPLPMEPIPNTKIAVMIAPTNANQIYCLAVLMLKKEIPQTTNKCAPVFTPKMLGSAMDYELRIALRAPETPNAAPHIKLKTVLAILWRTTFAPWDLYIRME